MKLLKMWKDKSGTLARCIAIPLIVGGLAGILSGGGMRAFAALNKPAFSPPGWVFPVVWTILYILMGISSYLICTADADKKRITEALSIYFYQLLVNFLWPILFFDFKWYLFSFLWIVLLWFLIIRMIRSFYPISKLAALCNIPYLLWVSFAAYLNLGIWWLVTIQP